MNRFRLRSRPLAPALLIGAALSLTSCSAVGGYIKDRALDLSDIVDAKVGYAVGVGAKAEASMYLGVGAGYGVIPRGREWYGRRSVVFDDHTFLHFGLGGWDGRHEGDVDEGKNATEWYQFALPVNLASLDHPWNPPFIQRFRFGGEFMIPLLNFGIYANVGEIFDFVFGIFTIDMAGDDGLSKLDKYGPNFSDLPEGEEAE